MWVSSNVREEAIVDKEVRMSYLVDTYQVSMMCELLKFTGIITAL